MLLMSNITISSAGVIQPFVMGSYSDILHTRQNRPFLLVFWSLDCPPCHKELAMLGHIKLQQPELDIVLVATDEEAHTEELARMLHRYQLQHAEAWVFAPDQSEQLRYEIDRNWYGELPRSYLFNARHQRIAVSGTLSAKSLQAWLQKNTGML